MKKALALCLLLLCLPLAAGCSLQGIADAYGFALDTLSAGALPVVLSIEAGLPPEELVQRHRLAELCDWFAACGMEALVLGCTHFPYFKEALARRTSLPLIDPAAEMLALLCAP